MSLCQQCGAENSASALTCAECGAALDQISMAAPRLLAHIQGLIPPEPVISTGGLVAEGDGGEQAASREQAVQASSRKGLPAETFDRLRRARRAPEPAAPLEPALPPAEPEAAPPALEDAQPTEPGPETAPPAVDDTQPIEPGPETEPPAADDTQPIEPGPETAPPAVDDTQPIEPGPETEPPAADDTQPIEPWPDGEPLPALDARPDPEAEPEAERPTLPVLARPGSAPTGWIALLLIGAILVGRIFADWPQTAPPIRPDVAAAHRLIAALPAASRVLLAWDYEPTTQGEMQLLALPILVQLRQRQAVVAHMSLRPLGPAMAAAAEEAAYGPLSAAGPFFPPATDLGFIPGGAAALRALALAPVAAAHLPELGAQGLGLSSDDPLTAFDLIIEFSAEAGTTQAWVEQIAVRQPTPLIVAASGVIGPVLRPYAQTGQIDALLEGYTDALAYESIVRGSGPASDQALAQTLAHLLLLALLLLALFRSAFARHV